MFAAQARGEFVRGIVMARKNSSATASDDIVEIEREIAQLMQDLETRVGRLNALTRRTVSNAANGASDFVSDTISSATKRVRNGAHSVTDEAGKLSNEAMHRLEEEIGQRPLLNLAIAAVIGFLAGMACRRH
jgi:ElaB/YqjD/DUF883 family membrane-anchored ribosome-binding protein